MAVTITSVKRTSITGEFNALDDDVITSVIEEVDGQYMTLLSELGIRQATADRLGSNHVAHILHRGLKEEAGGQDQPGPVKSATLARVGSWTFGSAAKLEGDGPFMGWQDSIYGHRAMSIWEKLPPAMFFSFPGQT